MAKKFALFHFTDGEFGVGPVSQVELGPHEKALNFESEFYVKWKPTPKSKFKNRSAKIILLDGKS